MNPVYRSPKVELQQAVLVSKSLVLVIRNGKQAPLGPRRRVGLYFGRSVSETVSNRLEGCGP